MRESSVDPAAAAAESSNDLAEHLSRLARAFDDEDNVDDTLTAIVRSAIDTIDGADHASISAVKRRREVTTVAATGDLPHRIDQAQYDTGQGPCLDSLYEKRTERLPDMQSDSRWPRFTAAAAGLGVASMLSVQLYVQDEDLGALNLHSERADAFDEEDEQVALIFAAHAAIAMATAKHHTDMQVAITTRDLIGQAKGILMERYRLPAERAFLLLVRVSQNSNIPLRQVAERLARTGVIKID